MKWKFEPNYLARAVVADAETNDIVLDTHTLDPQVAKACELLVEAHNRDVDRLALESAQAGINAALEAVRHTEGNGRPFADAILELKADRFVDAKTSNGLCSAHLVAVKGCGACEAVLSPPPHTPLFYIRSQKHDQHDAKGNEVALWWGKDKRGYTYDLFQAGLYTEAEALSICGPFGVPTERVKGYTTPDNIAYPVDMVEPLVTHAVNKFGVEPLVTHAVNKFGVENARVRAMAKEKKP